MPRAEGVDDEGEIRDKKCKSHQNQEDDFSLLDFPLVDITKCSNIKKCNAGNVYAGQYKAVVASPRGNGPECFKSGTRGNFIESLPDDILFIVLSYVSATILANINSVSMKWRSFSKQKLSSILWANLYSRQYASPVKGFFLLPPKVRHIVAKISRLSSSKEASKRELG